MAKVSDKSKSISPVRDPSLNLVSESMRPVEAYLKSELNSKYRTEFKAKPFDIPLRNPGKLYYPNTQKMDLLTTSEVDFAYKQIPARPIKEAPKTPQKTSINSITSYNGNFPNWGSTHVFIEKRFQPPLRSTEIPFQGKSSYRESFKNAAGNSLSFSKGQFSGFSAHLDTLPLGSPIVKEMQTTYKQNMQNFSNLRLNYREKLNLEGPQKLVMHSKHFTTTTKETYRTSDNQVKDLRLARISHLGFNK